MDKNTFCFTLESKTWNIDSYGLFDYHNNITKQIIDIKLDNQKENVVEIFRIANKIYSNSFMSQSYLGIDGFKNFQYKPELLFTIYKHDSKFYLSNQINFEMNDENMKVFLNKIWICFKQINSLSYKNLSNLEYNEFIIRENSILRFGRCVFKVNKLKINENNLEENDNNQNDLIKSCLFDSSIIDSTICCRYCFNDLNDEDKIENPLVSLCKCKGGSRYIHYKCVKQWMNLKLNIKESKNVKNFYFKSFNCEICKVPYPCKIV